jgi:UDP-GlcNAc:undecaprenyl-phosphate GlcNAc-1-phosphate transferase
MYITFLIAFLLCMITTPLARALALLFDIADTDVKSHKKPVAYLGGGAIFVSTLPAFLVALRLYGYPVSPVLFGILAGCTGMICLGLLDDILVLKPITKFAFQILIAAYSASLGVKTNLFGIQALDYAFTLFWLVGMSNAMNLIDIMDGLSAGVTLLAATTFAFIFRIDQNFTLSMLMVALMGACLGFLRYNFNPARIFMGDMGSLFLGYLLAAVPVTGLWQDGFNAAVHVPLLALFIPIFETCFLFVVRIRAGKSPFQGSKDHFALRMVRRGMSVTETVFFTYYVGAGFGVLALLAYLERFVFAGLAAAFLFTVVFVIKLLSSEDSYFLQFRRRRGP